MKFNTIDDLKAAGFEGFIPVVQLQADSTAIPRTAGVYMVVYTEGNMPEFLSHGTGGFFKGKDPNVSITELETNWVENTCVVYIGKAGTTLRKRLNQYLKFGNGQNIWHWGGRYIWQIKNSGNLLLCWKPTRRRSRSDRNRTHRPIQRTARGTQTFRQSQRLKAEGISMQSQGRSSILP